MNNFNFQTEIQKIIENKQLAEVRFRDVPGEFKVAFILNINAEFITLAEVDNLGELDGIGMYFFDQISSINTSTLYLNRLKKNVTASVWEEAMKSIAGVTDFSFSGLAAFLEKKKKFVEVAYEADFMPVGKIVGYDNQALSFIEIDELHTQPIAHTVILLSAITRMSLDTPYIRDIETSLNKRL